MTWTLRSLIRAAGVRAEVRGDAPLGGMAQDSRRVRPGDLFCCVPGRVVDGHDFADQAVVAGAAALLVERFLDIEVPQARTGRVRDALGPLAHEFYGRPSHELDVLAVTGTNGKTTVTYLLEAVGRAAGRCVGVVGTVSRRFAGQEEPADRNTPEAVDLQALLRRMREAGVDLVALEATSDGLEQGRLRATRVRVAGFTNLTQDHLDTHGSMDAYFRAKACLFDPDLSEVAVVNAADPYGRRLVKLVRPPLRLLTYGPQGADLTFQGEAGPDGIAGRLSTPWGGLDVRSPLLGAHNIENVLCAAGMALALGIEPGAVESGIAALAGVPGRLERVDAGQPFLALVDYAHTPDALERVLTTCRGLGGGRLIVVFGCGGDRDRAKRPLMGEVATSRADLAILTSDNPRSEDPEAILMAIEEGARRGGGEWCAVIDRREAIRRAVAEARAGDVVLVAGKGHEQGQEFAHRTLPFDDRTVLREELEDAGWKG